MSLRYRIVVEWKLPPTPADLAALNSYGERSGNNERFLKRMAKQIATMPNVAAAVIDKLE